MPQIKTCHLQLLLEIETVMQWKRNTLQRLSKETITAQVPNYTTFQGIF